MFRQTSLGSIGLTIGGILTLMGFVAYGTGNSTLNLIGFFYGIPLALGGLALKASELKPVPFSEPTSPAVLALREQQATPTQKQVIRDITRYRYGQEAHLDSSLESLGLSPTDEERPILVGLRESNRDGNYALTLEFESPLISLETWQQKQARLEAFFGPGVEAQLHQAESDGSQSVEDPRVDLILIANSEAAD